MDSYQIEQNQANSVSEIVNLIKEILEGTLTYIKVIGEVSNKTFSPTGHYYFTLSDRDSSLQVCLFKMDAYKNPAFKEIKNGDQIQCEGGIGVYSKRGSFQLIARKVTKCGAGNLLEKLEILKKKLAHEGLFDLDRKKIIPQFPRKIAVITSPKGAAVRDFVEVIKRRCVGIDVIIIPTLVQGELAPKSLIHALKIAQNMEEVDVIVLTRGGGSMEDLWCFNSEELVRKIYECDKVVISAIGHQIDFTLTDFVADFRAETPTAAAEILSAPQVKILEHLEQLKNRLKFGVERIFSKQQNRFEKCHLPKMLDVYVQRIFKLNEKEWFLDQSLLQLQNSMNRLIEERSIKLNELKIRIDGLNPKNILQRGYTFVQTNKSEVVGNIEKFNLLSPHDEIVINFYDGAGIVKKVGV
jgi:exodeoxyribonuclease VII large subunit